MNALEREGKKPRRANKLLKLASAFFAQAELYRRLKSSANFSATTVTSSGRADLLCLAGRPVGRRHAALLRASHALRRGAARRRSHYAKPARLAGLHAGLGSDFPVIQLTFDGTLYRCEIHLA